MLHHCLLFVVKDALFGPLLVGCTMSNMLMGAIVIGADFLVTAFPAKAERALETINRWMGFSQAVGEDLRYYGSVAGNFVRSKTMFQANTVAPVMPPRATAGTRNVPEEICIVSDATIAPVQSTRSLNNIRQEGAETLSEEGRGAVGVLCIDNEEDSAEQSTFVISKTGSSPPFLPIDFATTSSIVPDPSGGRALPTPKNSRLRFCFCFPSLHVSSLSSCHSTFVTSFRFPFIDISHNEATGKSRKATNSRIMQHERKLSRIPTDLGRDMHTFDRIGLGALMRGEQESASITAGPVASLKMDVGARPPACTSPNANRTSSTFVATRLSRSVSPASETATEVASKETRKNAKNGALAEGVQQDQEAAAQRKKSRRRSSAAVDRNDATTSRRKSKDGKRRKKKKVKADFAAGEGEASGTPQPGEILPTVVPVQSSRSLSNSMQDGAENLSEEGRGSVGVFCIANEEESTAQSTVTVKTSSSIMPNPSNSSVPTSSGSSMTESSSN